VNLHLPCAGTKRYSKKLEKLMFNSLSFNFKIPLSGTFGLSGLLILTIFFSILKDRVKGNVLRLNKICFCVPEIICTFAHPFGGNYV